MRTRMGFTNDGSTVFSYFTPQKAIRLRFFGPFREEESWERRVQKAAGACGSKKQ